MELACALVLLIVGSVTAGPYGYGTKGGAAAKADARAVAGAYSGAGSIPLSIPSGASYSGSFSQSSSSSSSSSSASSNSFSYSGSGTSGGVVPGSNGCGSGNCNAGGASGSQGSAAAGSQAYSGANAGSLAGGYGGKIQTGSYGHNSNIEGQANKGQNCGSESCQGTSDLNSPNGSGAGVGSQYSSDAKAAASAGAGHTTGSDCGGSDCNNIPGADKKCVSGHCGSGDKCSSGDCGAASHIGTPTQYDDSNKCASGQCGLNHDTDGSSSIDSETNDINVHSSGSANSKSSYGGNKPGCSNGNCGSPPALGTPPASGYNKPGCSNGNCGSLPAPGIPAVSGYNKPALDLTAPKLEPSCFGSNCPISAPGYSSSQTKAPYIATSYQSHNQLGHVSSPGNGGLLNPHGSSPSHFPVKPSGGAGCAPGTPGCGDTSPFLSGPSDCSSGNCGSNPSSPGYEGPSSGKPSYSYGSRPLVNPSSTACAPGTPGCFPNPSAGVPSVCVFGNCGTHPSVPSVAGPKPSDAYGSSPLFSSVNPSGAACAPGTPGCNIPSSPGSPSDCTSGNCGAYPSGFTSSSGIKPGYSHGSSPTYSSVNPSGPACSPDSPGCTTSPSAPSNCASGNCGGSPISTGYSDFSNKPSYHHSSSPSYTPLKPSIPGCAPGSPGCASAPSATGSSDCTSGECRENPTAPGFVSSSNIKPGYSHGSLPSHTSVKPVGLPCAPGTPGCSTAPSASGVPDEYPPIGGQGGFPSIKPSYSQGSSSYFPKPSGSGCAPGAPGCEVTPSIKPSYSQGSSSYFPKPSGSGCAPGAPGCAVTPSLSSPSGCASGNCGANPSAPGYGGSSIIKPNYSQGGLPLFSTLIPSDPVCTPGSPGCAPTGGPSGCASGKCGTHPTSAGSGSLGIKPSYSYGSLSAPTAPSGPSGCISGNCDEFPPIGGQGGFPSIKPSYSQGSSSYFPKPSGSGCAPGAPGCAVTPSLSSPSGCASGNCGANLSPGCAPGTPGCSGSTSNIHSGASGFPLDHQPIGASVPVSGVPSYGASSLPSGPDRTGIITPGYGASGVGSSSQQAAYGIHGTGSLQASFIKPSTGFPTGTSDSGAYTPGLPSTPAASSSTPSIGSSPHIGIVGASAGASGQHDSKENLPAYTGGFGGPAGILKPNEYSGAHTSSYDNKPAALTGPTTVKPGCVSGTCDAHASPSHAQSGTASGAHATAGASASANAVAYTGGFGGPPGLLKPYDGGKADIKGAIGLGTSLDLHQGVSGNGFLNSRSQAGGSTVAQANAAAVSSAGAISGDSKLHGGNHGGYSHKHDGAGGCGGGCGGSGSGNLGYSRSLSLSKTGTLDDSSDGLTSAGAVAKSVANASSGASAFGNSYASSSATAHSGASVKGGYGRR